MSPRRDSSQHHTSSASASPVSPATFAWWLSGPILFGLWAVVGFQGELRGASGLLQVFLLAAVLLTAGMVGLLRRFLGRVAEEYHEIGATVVLCAVFFPCWTLGSVLAEELYVMVDGYEGRRIYADDSGMGYALGFKNLPGAVGASLVLGLFFGIVWGTLLGVARKIIVNMVKRRP